MKFPSLVHIVSIPIAFSLGFLMVVAVFGIKQQSNDKTISHDQTTPSPTHIALSPPSQALTGILSNTKGKVERIPWDISTHIPATEGSTLYQGDEIITLENAQASIHIPQNIDCDLEENTHILLGNLLPQTITLQLRNGTAACKNQSTVSLKIPAALIELHNSTFQSIVTNELVKVILASGSGTVGFVNNDNKTNIWQLENKDMVTIDRETNTLRTTGTLLSSD